MYLVVFLVALVAGLGGGGGGTAIKNMSNKSCILCLFASRLFLLSSLSLLSSSSSFCSLLYLPAAFFTGGGGTGDEEGAGGGGGVVVAAGLAGVLGGGGGGVEGEEEDDDFVFFEAKFRQASTLFSLPSSHVFACSSSRLRLSSRFCASSYLGGRGESIQPKTNVRKSKFAILLTHLLSSLFVTFLSLLFPLLSAPFLCEHKTTYFFRTHTPAHTFSYFSFAILISSARLSWYCSSINSFCVFFFTSRSNAGSGSPSGLRLRP